MGKVSEWNFEAEWDFTKERCVDLDTSTSEDDELDYSCGVTFEATSHGGVHLDADILGGLGGTISRDVDSVPEALDEIIAWFEGEAAAHEAKAAFLRTSCALARDGASNLAAHLAGKPHEFSEE